MTQPIASSLITDTIRKSPVQAQKIRAGHLIFQNGTYRAVLRANHCNRGRDDAYVVILLGRAFDGSQPCQVFAQYSPDSEIIRAYPKW